MNEGTKVLVAAQAVLGECTLWCEREQALYWTDIDSALLSRWSAGDGAVKTWPLPEALGSFALCERPGRLLLGLASGVALFDLSSGQIGLITRVEADQPATRINDGRCDPQGRFVFGMFNCEGAATGGFYRVGPDLALERLPLPAAAVGNCLSFRPEHGGKSQMYFSDSPTRCIYRLDYHADGRLGEPVIFTRLAPGDGEPDGATVDAQGFLWVALWGAGCVARFDAQGREVLRLPVPASQPTCPSFGGPGLDRLFLSSAGRGVAGETQAGHVFELLSHGSRGRAEHRFRTP